MKKDTPKEARPREPRLEKLRLSELVPHPLQGLYNGSLTEYKLAALAANIRKRKLQHPPEVMPPGNRAGLPAYTILDGHARKDALELNGETEVTALVRFDLVDADPDAVELEFLQFNQDRRHHDLLAEARVALRAFEIEKGRGRGQLRGREEEDARDRVGKVLNMSGRNLQRYWRVLKTPVEVQDAFRAKQLSLVEAGKVADLRPKVQAEVAARIKAGEPPRKVLGEYLGGKHNGRHVKVGDALVAFRKSLVRGLNDLGGRVAAVPTALVDPMREDLQQAKDVIEELLAKGSGKGRVVRGEDEEE
jgi:hypothetical protein